MPQRTTPVARRLGRPTNTVSADTHDRLLAGARRAFAHDGYAATTNRAIADAAGVTAGAIYHYFPSKADLYVAVYEQVQTIVFGEWEKAIAPYDGFVERFCAVLDRSVGMTRADPSIAGFVVGVAIDARRHPELRRLLTARRSVNTEFMQRLANDAAERGELVGGVSARSLEDLLNAMVSGLIHVSNQSGCERHAAAIDALKQLMTGSLLRGT